MQKAQMLQRTKLQKAKPSPTLNTVIMVEKAIQDSNNSLVTVAELKRVLPKQVNHNTLMVILEYLDKCNKIDFRWKGIVWLENNNPNIRRIVKYGRRWTKAKGIHGNLIL